MLPIVGPAVRARRILDSLIDAEQKADAAIGGRADAA
jgi:hypothetical protein